MTAKDYLKGLQRLNTVINQKQKEYDDLQHMSTAIGSFDTSKERVQTSLPADAGYTKKIERMIDLQAEINEEIDRYVDEKHKIINQIQGLSNERHVAILYKRYVEFKRLEVIAVEMNYTYQYTRELHGHALQEFDRMYLQLPT